MQGLRNREGEFVEGGKMIKPYYENENGRLYHGDCLEILPHLEPVDLVLTDPPYNEGINYGAETNDNMNEDYWIGWMKPRFNLFKNIGDTVLISTGIERLAWYAKIEQWKWLFCWYKPASMGRCSVGFTNWEPVAAWGSVKGKGVDVIKAVIKPSKMLSGHPCPKPVGWALGFLNIFKEGAVVDPFLGSGTTAVACERLKRKWIGIEISKEYCDIAVKRIEHERQQLKLF